MMGFLGLEGDWEGVGGVRGKTFRLFLECVEYFLKVGAEGADFLDGGAKLSVEGFVFFNLSGDDGEDSICPLWYGVTLIED